jgi:TonB family protein
MIRWTSFFLPAAVVLLALALATAQQQPVPVQSQEAAYPESSDGLQKFLQDILEAAKSKDTGKETALIRTLGMPEDSAWFQDEFGPAFGARLATAYRKAAPPLEEELRTVYEGNVERGWLKPKILRYADAASVDSPTDHFLNCMEEVVPLYQTAFNGDRTTYQLSRTPSESGRMRIVAGDLPGYYVYANGGFRFVPQQIFFMLPKERPVRIQLDMNVMRSKLTNDVRWTYPAEAIRQHISGKVVVHLVLDTSGKIKEINLVEGPPILRDVVLQAVRQWSFEPTTLDGDPVEVEMNVEASFAQFGQAGVGLHPTPGTP